jgi:MarR family transcriptional regulator, lower aerobic nicotinate degradation pathway regulator
MQTMDAGNSPDTWQLLARRPGFLIRRLRQIHLALFADACGEFGLTPVQYSILTVAAARPGLDQAAVANEVGVDRATMADGLARLEWRGLIARRGAVRDARLKLERVTVAGRRLPLPYGSPRARRA